MSIRLLAALAYGVIVFLPLLAVIGAAGWEEENVFFRLGNGLVLVVFPIMALQPILAARLKRLDRGFGLDIIYVLHKTMGMTAGTLLLCAVIFLIAGPVRQVPWYGTGGMLFVLVLVLSALLYRELRMTYEAWRVLHNVLFIAAFIAVFAQVWSIVSDSGNLPAKIIVAAVLIAAVTAYLFHKVIGPSRRRKLLYRVVSVNRETRNAWTLTFKPPEGAVRFAFLPGQFQFLTFGAGRGEEHPFTISSSPTGEGVHSATIKESGDFTRTIGTIQPGELIAVQAPFGRFSYVLYPEERDLVFIAGGIGITPFMSMLRHMRDSATDREVLLLYANNTEEDIAFRSELNAIASQAPPRLRVVHVLSRAGEGWRGERGRIDRAMIGKKVTGELVAKTFYLCGPPPMMTAVIATLFDLGIPSHRIRSERFAL
jgi:predicted ferric reductase